MKLWKAYWLYGVGVSCALALVFAYGVYRQSLLTQQLAVLALVPYTIWVLAMVWRSSANGATLWSALARYSTVAWACNAALVLGFLELELLAKFTA